MTRHNGIRILACSHCDALHAKRNVVSVNYMARENWTDGRTVQSLFDSREGLGRCTQCREYLLEKYTINLGVIGARVYDEPSPDSELGRLLLQIRDPMDADSPTDKAATPMVKNETPWLQCIKQWWSSASRWSDSAVKPAPDDDLALPHPMFERVADSELAGMIENRARHSAEMMLSVRLLYWRYLNDPYRETAGLLEKQGLDPLAAYQLSKAQKENMLALIELLQSEGGDSNQIAELYRELGAFERALAYLRNSRPDDRAAQTILAAAQQNISAPVRIYYSHQMSLGALDS